MKKFNPFILILIVSLFSNTISITHLANETELLAFQALQLSAAGPNLALQSQLILNEIKNSVKVKAVPGLFAQQLGVEPDNGCSQLDNFGALKPWEEILHNLVVAPNQRLLLMIRHGQAWENLNPTPNSNCEFVLNGEVIQNFDSPITPEGQLQARTLNNLLLSSSSNPTCPEKRYKEFNYPNKTWFKVLGMASNSSTFLVSPLSRTLQTTQEVFRGLNLASGQFVVSEIVRATIGRDVCNFRRSIKTPTSDTVLPWPWQSGCSLPSDSLEDLYGIDSPVKFSFPIRPAGGDGFGLISDYDNLWRSDFADDEILTSRASAFLSQLFAYTPDSSVSTLVTHGEFINAIYRAAGEYPYEPKNTQVVPLLVELQKY